jgi:hypothetical protein
MTCPVGVRSESSAAWSQGRPARGVGCSGDQRKVSAMARHVLVLRQPRVASELARLFIEKSGLGIKNHPDESSIMVGQGRQRSSSLSSRVLRVTVAPGTGAQKRTDTYVGALGWTWASLLQGGGRRCPQRIPASSVPLIRRPGETMYFWERGSRQMQHIRKETPETFRQDRTMAALRGIHRDST